MRDVRNIEKVVECAKTFATPIKLAPCILEKCGSDSLFQLSSFDKGFSFHLFKMFSFNCSFVYVNRHVNYITFVDGKYGRKCLPLPASDA